MDFRFLSRSVGRLVIFTVLGCLLGPSAVAQAQPVDAGFRGPAFPSGIGGDEEVTAEKPESKLWWNDGSWWGGLWSSAAGTYRIYRLDMATQQWVDTGTALDPRSGTKMDVFWDDKPVNPTDRKLYVASHWWTTNAGAATLRSAWKALPVQLRLGCQTVQPGCWIPGGHQHRENRVTDDCERFDGTAVGHMGPESASVGQPHPEWERRVLGNTVRASGWLDRECLER